jgi:hypothetical protein
MDGERIDRRDAGSGLRALSSRLIGDCCAKRVSHGWRTDGPQGCRLRPSRAEQSPYWRLLRQTGEPWMANGRTAGMPSTPPQLHVRGVVIPAKVQAIVRAQREHVESSSRRKPGPSALVRRLTTSSFSRRRESILPLLFRRKSRSGRYAPSAPTFAPIGAPRDPVADPTGPLDSTKGPRADQKYPSPTARAWDPTLAPQPLLRFVGTLSHTCTEVGSRRDRARLERPATRVSYAARCAVASRVERRCCTRSRISYTNRLGKLELGKKSNLAAINLPNAANMGFGMVVTESLNTRSNRFHCDSQRSARLGAWISQGRRRWSIQAASVNRFTYIVHSGSLNIGARESSFVPFRLSPCLIHIVSRDPCTSWWNISHHAVR